MKQEPTSRAAPSPQGLAHKPDDSHALRVFINYRRDDAAGDAGRLYDALSVRLGKGSVFMDIDAIQPGADFADVINQAVGSCDVLVTVIGKSWISIANADGRRRLDDPRDLVRLEIQSALKHKIRVVPALVQGAQMPRADQLPKSLAKLAGRNAFEISHGRWQQDVERLITTLQEPTSQREAPIHNLPRQLTRFVGRSEDVSAVKRTLSTARLLTLTGTGGCGKTRLALQTAAEILDEYPNGVWLIEFAPVADPALVPQVVASTLGVREQPGHELTETLITRLREQRALLIMDNCEHLVTACARLADAVLRTCADVHILATSREALNVSGEVSYRVPSLGLPHEGDTDKLHAIAGSDAVQLFIDRAQLARPEFALNETNASAVAEVCRRLDGIPLAIELAAARVRMMPPGEILDRLKDRFRLLTLGGRTAPSRHQALQATVEWSYRLLSESEQILFNRLSVFAGGFSLDAAEAVCAGDGLADDHILDLLSALVDKSLVVVGEDSGGRSRYMLLETLREYGRERLEKAAVGETRTRHATYFRGAALEAEAQLTGPEQATSLRQLEDDHDNLRAALQWLVDANENELALSLASTLVQFWLMHGHLTEGRRWFAGRIAGSSARPAIRAKALLGQGSLAWRQADYLVATSSTEASLAIWRELGDKAGIVQALNILGAIFKEQEDAPAALAYFEESLALAREANDRRAIARALNNLGALAFDRGDYGAARLFYLESLALKKEIGARSQIAITTFNLAEVLLEQADHEGAWSRYEDSLLVFRELGDQVMLGACFDGFSALAAAHGQPERALRLAGAAESQRKEVGSIVHPAGRTKQGSRLALSRQLLGPAAAAIAFKDGSEMALDDAVAEALAVDVSQPLTAQIRN